MHIIIHKQFVLYYSRKYFVIRTEGEGVIEGAVSNLI